MKRFDEHELDLALAHAAAGGVALYLHKNVVRPSNAHPSMPWRRRRPEDCGHLYDMDPRRLRQTAKEIGLYRHILIHDIGTPRQHLTLWGTALARALELFAEVA